MKIYTLKMFIQISATLSYTCRYTYIYIVLDNLVLETLRERLLFATTHSIRTFSIDNQNMRVVEHFFYYNIPTYSEEF